MYVTALLKWLQIKRGYKTFNINVLYYFCSVICVFVTLILRNTL
jgi:hypothetical protein